MKRGGFDAVWISAWGGRNVMSWRRILKEKEAKILEGSMHRKRKGRHFLHTTVPANLLRNELTSVFHIKAPIQFHIHPCSIGVLFTFWLKSALNFGCALIQIGFHYCAMWKFCYAWLVLLFLQSFIARFLKPCLFECSDYFCHRGQIVAFIFWGYACGGESGVIALHSVMQDREGIHIFAIVAHFVMATETSLLHYCNTGDGQTFSWY